MIALKIPIALFGDSLDTNNGRIKIKAYINSLSGMLNLLKNFFIIK